MRMPVARAIASRKTLILPEQGQSGRNVIFS
jgi:hypothetical protein